MWSLVLASAPSLALEASISGVDNSDLAANIRAHLTTLSSPRNCQLSNDAVLTIEEKIFEAAKAYGYYQLKVNDVTLPDTNNCDRVTLQITQGPQVKITELTVKVTGEGSADPVFKQAIEDFPLRLNGPLIHSQYKNGKKKFDSIALNRGYFDSDFSTAKIEVDGENNTATVTLVYESGPRYKFGSLLMPEEQRAKDLISKVLPFKPGAPYLASKLGEFNQNLNQTGYFQQVVARPLLDDADELQIPIEVIAVSRPRDIFDVGVGASTDTGPRFTLGWQRPWVNDSGHSMEADLYLSDPNQSISAKYRVPIGDPLKDFVSYQVGFNSLNDKDGNSDTFSVAVQRHWTPDDSDWNNIGFLRYIQSRFSQADSQFQTTRLLIPGFTLSRYRSRGGLDFDWGDSQQLTIETATKEVVSDIDLTRITFKTKWLRSIGEHRFLLRGEIGGLETSDFDQVPTEYRYFTGGDQSVRGFSFGELAPREIDENGEKGERIGGKYVNVGSIEYSYPVADGWRAAVFTDVGGASDKPFEKLAYSFGVGGIWLSPVGPIRIYVAHGRGDFGTSNHIHFSMGPPL